MQSQWGTSKCFSLRLLLPCTLLMFGHFSSVKPSAQLINYRLRLVESENPSVNGFSNTGVFSSFFIMQDSNLKWLFTVVVLRLTYRIGH